MYAYAQKINSTQSNARPDQCFEFFGFGNILRKIKPLKFGGFW
jgi:hypothetical protein